MSSLADLRPGDIGFGPLWGLGNPLVAAGQMILGEGFTVGKLNIGPGALAAALLAAPGAEWFWPGR